LQQEKIELQQTLLEQQETLFNQQQALIEGLHTQVGLLEEQVQALQERLKKGSHNSRLPPSSDRFHRQHKSLRKRSGKKAGGQPDHPESTLMLSPTPDQVIVHLVECCQHCQRDLREMESLQVECRQVFALPRQQRGGHRTPGPTEVLPQLSADQHGAVPIVRAIGGLVDTVFDRDYSGPPAEERNGYMFHQVDHHALESAMSRPIGLWYA
jgi:hypothetical protein